SSRSSGHIPARSKSYQPLQTPARKKHHNPVRHDAVRRTPHDPRRGAGGHAPGLLGPGHAAPPDQHVWRRRLAPGLRRPQPQLRGPAALAARRRGAVGPGLLLRQRQRPDGRVGLEGRAQPGVRGRRLQPRPERSRPGRRPAAGPPGRADRPLALAERQHPRLHRRRAQPGPQGARRRPRGDVRHAGRPGQVLDAFPAFPQRHLLAQRSAST
ncbi:Sperm-associated antigen 1, partial [Frankliniella fusca]